MERLGCDESLEVASETAKLCEGSSGRGTGGQEQQLLCKRPVEMNEVMKI